MKSFARFSRSLTGLVLVVGSLWPQPAPAAPPPIRFMLHGNMSHELPTEEYLRFVERIKPDILVMGLFDQRLYATAAPGEPKPKNPPLPPGEILYRWKVVADRLHKSGIRLVGQMELGVLSDQPGDLSQRNGWFGYYERHWDEKLLGRRPAQTAAELLEEPDIDRHPDRAAERDALARCGCRVNLKALHACLNKPAWRATQKAMVKTAIEHGVDGFLTNRNYVNHCACPQCTRKFRAWLTERYTPEQLRQRFGIVDVDKQLLCMVGAHRDHDSVPGALGLERQRFAKHMVKEFFDEVYIDYGRSLKGDLLVAQWNHMAYFDELHLDRGHLPPSTRTGFAHAAADERWGLPAAVWGKGESLLWYCNWGTTQNTLLEKEYAGDTVPYGKLLRALARGTPYVINKYDFYRPRNLMAEAAALGYVTNALATPWQTEEDRDVMIRYFDFLKKHDALYRPADSLAEVALVFPQRALQAGDAAPLEYTEAAGRALVRQHVLFDVLPDELLSQTALERYRVLLLAGLDYLQEPERKALRRHVERGGKVLLTPVSSDDRERRGAASEAARRMLAEAAPWKIAALTVANPRTDRGAFIKALQDAAPALSRFDAPWTVEVHAYRQAAAKRLVLHFVNYNHNEKGAGKSVVAREAPVAADPVKVHLSLPEDFQVREVTFLSPDEDRTRTLEFAQRGGTLELRTPGFLVYGVCVVAGR
jgi:hypothetical protein